MFRISGETCAAVERPGNPALGHGLALGPKQEIWIAHPSALAREPDGTSWIGTYGPGVFRGRPGRWVRFEAEGLGPKH
ncbi:MAG: hypothetical protein JNL97_14490 [Verrucomicrobiales bacterium]|nr:hypothetical protein [Verrucomicrobiales bacterium]